MISPTSRYAGSGAVMTNETLSIPVRPRSLQRSFNFRRYRVSEPDRVDILAHKHLNNAGEWYLLADSNPENLYPEYTAGSEIRIPYASSV